MPLDPRKRESGLRRRGIVFVIVKFGQRNQDVIVESGVCSATVDTCRSIAFTDAGLGLVWVRPVYNDFIIASLFDCSITCSNYIRKMCKRDLNTHDMNMRLLSTYFELVSLGCMQI